MERLLDTLQILFWSATYLCIVVYGLMYRQSFPLMMPYIAGSLNFSWELNALIESQGFWGHIIWLGLDVFIICFNVRNLKSLKNRICYLLLTGGLIVVLWFIFQKANSNGMLLSVFIIDLIMAIEFVITAKSVSNHGRVIIAITKLLGDFFAWLTYADKSIIVAFIGFVVQILNLVYLSICLELNSPNKYRKNKN